MKVAVVGATGLVGRKMIAVLEERNFPVTELLCVASERSRGQKLMFKGKEYEVITIAEAVAQKPQIVLFSAGGAVSLKHAPDFAAVGSVVIDNSSAWRMDKTKKLVVPEINGKVLTKEDKIIANPNCSTIQLLMAVYPLHRAYGIDRMVVSTYQSVTGSGASGVKHLLSERNKGDEKDACFYPHPIDLNVIARIDTVLDNGYTKEEEKIRRETQKILGDASIRVTATAVRVPVMAGHSESVNITFKKDYTLAEVRNLLTEMPGVVVVDAPTEDKYPTPLQAADKDEVFVGRLRRDESEKNALNMWVVSDNLRKGAATNAVQIAEYVVANRLVA